MSTKLVLLRHGQSDWNLKNLFTGWTDVDLTDKGREEAKEAARLLAAEGLEFDVAFTSVLKRAIRTLWIVMDKMDRMWVPVYRCWRLNERHYGQLQGLEKRATVARHGAAQVRSWRSSFTTPPPPVDPDDERDPVAVESGRDGPVEVGANRIDRSQLGAAGESDPRPDLVSVGHRRAIRIPARIPAP